MPPPLFLKGLPMHHRFRRPVQWRNYVIVGLVAYPEGTAILDQHGRELCWLEWRHLF